MMTDHSSPDIVERLRDRDAVVMSGLFHAIPTMREAADEIERLRNVAQSAPEQISFVEALSLAERGLELWKAKEHNAKWWRRIDGTPIPNDLLVNIAEEFSKCGLVYASTLPSADRQEAKP